MARPCLLAALLLVGIASRAEAQFVSRVVIASGTRTNGVVRRVVLQHLREIRRCVPGTLYELQLRLEIDAGGAVTSARARFDPAQPRPQTCVETAAATWTFPSSDQATRTRIVFSTLGGTPVPGPETVVRHPRPNVRMPAGENEGALDNAVTRRVVRQRANAFTHCYQMQLQNAPALSGEVVIRVVVDASGAVSDVQIVSETFPDDRDVPGCIVARVRLLTFPSADGPTTFTQRFVFAPPE